MLSIGYEMLTSFCLIAAFVAMVTSQTLKLIYYYFKEGRVNFDHLTEAAGMPSSHASIVSALSTAVGILTGWNSPTFAATFILSAIVMYDAAGVRQAAGKQAQVLNQMLDDINATGHIQNGRLTELLGHSPVEVFAGALLGITTTTLMYWMFFKWPVF